MPRPRSTQLPYLRHFASVVVNVNVPGERPNRFQTSVYGVIKRVLGMIVNALVHALSRSPTFAGSAALRPLFLCRLCVVQLYWEYTDGSYLL